MSAAITLIVSFFVLARASSLVVNTLVNIARYLSISEYTLAFLLMAIATSIPELFIAINSGIAGVGHLSLGNIIGANILNVTLVVGVVALLSKGRSFIIPEAARQDSWRAWFIALLPVILILDGVLSRIDGGILLVVYVLYGAILFSRKSELVNPLNSFRNHVGSLHSFLKNLALFVIGIILLLAASAFIVYIADKFVRILAIELAFFGILIVSIGTTIPELAFGVRSLFLNHGYLVSGNAIGSVVVNSTLVLGVLALISPISVSLTGSILASSIFLLISLWVFAVFMGNRYAIVSRTQAVFLLGLYFVFAIVLAVIHI